MIASTVTTSVLFTDLVGSTELLEKLGQERADAVRRRYFTLLRTALSDHAGTEVKNLGDGLMVVFPSASQALAAAVDMQRAVARHNRRADVFEIGVRVGVATGDTTHEDDDYFGVPVVQAARLCAEAVAGQILATKAVELMASGGDHDFESVGPLQLKGLADPVAAAEVLWDAPSGSVIPLPRTLRLPEPVGFVGRSAERMTLARLWGDAVEGSGRLALIGGEPGVGKTRLSSELARDLHREGATVLVGRCDENLAIPYQPFVEALTSYVTSCPLNELREQLGPLGRELSRLVPSLPDLVPDLPPPLAADPATELYRLLESIVELLGNASQAAPIVLILDDLHWAARPTLNVLQQVVRAASGMRLLTIATFRDSDFGPDDAFAAWLADITREHGVERMMLAGFDESEVVAFVEESAGHRLDDDERALTRSVGADTGGNPFFLGQVLRHLVETGGVVLDGDRWRALAADTMTIPEGVRDLVSRRVGRLGERGRELLSVGSVVGAEFDLDLVESVCNITEDELLEAVDDAEAARLILSKSPNRYAFSHALVRTTIYRDLTAARRARLHGRVAQAIEARHGATVDDHALELSHHYFEAISTGDAERACRFSRIAGDQARFGLAFDEAATLYARALEALDFIETPSHELDAARCELLTVRGETSHRAGDPSWRETLLEATALARSLGDGERFAHAVLAFSHWNHPSAVGVIDDELVGLLEEAIEVLADADSTLRARLLALLAVELTFSPDADRRDTLSREALAIIEGVDDRRARQRVLMSGLWVAINNPSDTRTPLKIVDRLLVASDELRDLEGQYYGHLMRYSLDMMDARTDEADESLAIAVDLAGRLHQPAYLWNATLLRGSQTLLAGQLEEAEALINETMKIGNDALLPESLAFACYGGQLFWLRHDQGRLGELEELIASVVDEQPGMPSWRSALAMILCSKGQLEDARIHYEVAAARDFTDAPRDFVWLSGKLILADVTTALVDAPRGRLLTEQLVPRAGSIGWNTLACTGPVDMRLGTLATIDGRFEDARRHLAASAAICESARAPVWGARTALAQSQLALAADDPEAAAVHARDARARALAVGAAGVAADANGVLASV